MWNLYASILRSLQQPLGRFVFLGLVFLYGSHDSQQVDRPNIVWLVTEDNSTHFLNLYQEGGAIMPNVESLAEKGLVFTHAFSNAPVCSVARSTLISGCYAPRLGVQYHRKMEKAALPDGLDMFPTYLRREGYYTSNNSKEDYNFIKNEGIWDESSRNASYRNREADQPFFHVQNFGITHEGQLHFSEEDIEAQPSLHDPDVITPFPYHPNTELFRYTYARQLDNHLKADNQIGAFLQQLEDDGLMDDTIIFYYGDHGGVLPRSKGYVYESGVHVPLVVYIPEKWKSLSPYEAGNKIDAFVEFVDFAPTVLNLAGIETPGEMDGRAFLGEDIPAESLGSRNSAFSYADRFDEKYDLVRALRIGDYKYVRNYQPFNIDGLYNFYRNKMLAYQEWEELYNEGMLNDVQSQFFQSRPPEALYNLKEDPNEVKNLANDPSQNYRLIDMRLALQAKLKDLPDLSFFPEPYFLEHGLEDPLQFGQTYKKDIAKLIEIADLSLMPFDRAKKGIVRALESTDPWQRYWGLIVCSSFGDSASEFYQKIKKMASDDTEPLVQIRAIEFIALSREEINEELIESIILDGPSESSVNLMLNTLALLKMKGLYRSSTNLPKTAFEPSWHDQPNDLVNRRLDYINQ